MNPININISLPPLDHPVNINISIQPEIAHVGKKDPESEEESEIFSETESFNSDSEEDYEDFDGEPVELSLRKFSPGWIDENSTCLFIGKPITGKTTAIQDILHHDFHAIKPIIVSGLDLTKENYKTSFPDAILINEDSTDIDVSESNCIVVDDYCEPQSQLFNNLFNKKNIAKFISMQYLWPFTPQMRAKVDYVFIFGDNNIHNHKRLYNQYASIFPEFNMFESVLAACTEDYSCMVIDHRAILRKSKEQKGISDYVYWYHPCQTKVIGVPVVRSDGPTYDIVKL